MELTVFSFDSYTGFIKSYIDSSERSWGLASRLADAAGCQRSYFSQVLKGEMHLTLEHAQKLADHWRFNEDEADYFSLLVELERASGESYRQRLLRRIRRYKQEHEDISRRLKQDAATVSDFNVAYYSSWHWAAIDLALSVPGLQTVKKIAERLSLPPHLVKTCLETLESQGHVSRQGREEWRAEPVITHLPKSSPLVGLHHSNWRSRAVLDAQNPLTEGMHYTMVQGVSRESIAKIKDLVLSTIDDYNAIAGPTPEEELVCFACDFFVL